MNMLHVSRCGYRTKLDDIMEKHDEIIKCKICGYYLKQSEITSVYLSGKISKPQKDD